MVKILQKLAAVWAKKPFFAIFLGKNIFWNHNLGASFLGRVCSCAPGRQGFPRQFTILFLRSKAIHRAIIKGRKVNAVYLLLQDIKVRDTNNQASGQICQMV
jgi:hypothetical protein